jgi:hypothetical protein
MRTRMIAMDDKKPKTLFIVRPPFWNKAAPFYSNRIFRPGIFSRRMATMTPCAGAEFFLFPIIGYLSIFSGTI